MNNSPKAQPTRIMSYENKLLRLALVIGLVPTLLLIAVLYFLPISVYFKVLLGSLVSGCVLYGAFEIRRQVTMQLRTATNLMEALNCGDFSLRATNNGHHSALSEFNYLLNSLADSMAQQNLINREHQILLRKVIDYIDVAIIAVDHQHCISLMNPAAERLFDQRFDKLDGAPIKAIGLHEVVTSDYKEVVEFEIKKRRQKVYLHSDEYFEQGNKHRLIFITDIQDILRDEERSAWQRLLRVLSHEINNSLAPIASISESLHRSSLDEQTGLELGDFQQGLAVISERSNHLNEFVKRYQQLTKLPAPQQSLVDIDALLTTTVGLFNQVDYIAKGRQLTCFADESQLQQVLVNLIKNAQEATSNTDSTGKVVVSANKSNGRLSIDVIDSGHGISNMDNIFVPFYTTKSSGTGIGLVLCRQIIRNHGGDLTLKNRQGVRGVIATISLECKQCD